MWCCCHGNKDWWAESFHFSDQSFSLVVVEVVGEWTCTGREGYIALHNETKINFYLLLKCLWHFSTPNILFMKVVSSTCKIHNIILFSRILNQKQSHSQPLPVVKNGITSTGKADFTMKGNVKVNCWVQRFSGCLSNCYMHITTFTRGIHVHPNFNSVQAKYTCVK